MERVPGRGAVYKLTDSKAANTLRAVLAETTACSVLKQLVKLLPRVTLIGTGARMCARVRRAATAVE